MQLILLATRDTHWESRKNLFDMFKIKVSSLSCMFDISKQVLSVQKW